jgi:UDP-sugar transporter A1/2/3
VVKGFATSLSIVLSSAVSLFIPSFHFSLTPAFLVGSSLVIAATILYSTLPTPAPANRRQAPPPSYDHGLPELKLV